MTLDDLLREFGFRPQEFPESLKADATLVRYVQDLPDEVRTESLDVLQEFFGIYKSLNDAQRTEMLETFESTLEREGERKP